MARIVLNSYMVRYPLGGNLSWALQWLTGLRELGHDVYLVEKAGWADACFDPSRRVMSDDCSYGVGVVRSLLAPLAMSRKFCFVDARGTYHGLARETIEAAFRSADLFIDMGPLDGSWLDEAQQAGTRILVDGEPAHTQMKMQNALDAGQALDHYDAYYSNGANVGTPSCTAPNAGLAWRHVFNPVVARLFGTPPPRPGAAFTTVMNWQSHDEIEFRGVRYGQKDVEFEKFEQLPWHVETPMEIAVSGMTVPVGRLTNRGWRIRDAHEVTATVGSYHGYIAASMGEFAVCKNVFVATRSGWFSDRSAAYLASGRPVVIQATGFEAHLPCGEGLFAVADMDHAAEAIREVTGDYPRHSAAARRIAVECLDAGVVLRRLLREVGV